MENEIDVELELAQKALAAAQQRKADAEAAARLAAAAALAKNLADEQERLAHLRREAEENERRWAEKRAAEEQAKRIEEAAKAAETRRLEAECEARQEAARKEAARQEAVRKVQEQARQLEIDAANLEASSRQAQTTREESKPQSLATLGPLAAVFGAKATPDIAAQREGLSSEQNAHVQAERDRAVTKEPARKAHPSVDITTSNDLVAVVKRELHINLNTQRADALSSQWTYDALLNAAQQVIEYAKSHPCGHDQICSMLEAALEAQQ